MVDMTTATRRKWTRKDRIEGRWRRYFQTRETKLRNELVETYLPLVRGLAAKLASRLPRCIDLDDLRGAGFIGLMNAVEHFDPTRNVKFEIYAKKRINGSMLDELRRQDALPREARDRTDEMRRCARALREELGRDPSPWEVATAMGVSLAVLREVALDSTFASHVSLDPLFNSNDSESLDGWKSRSEPIDAVPTPPEQVHRRELAQLVDSNLSKRERTIVRSVYQDQHTFKHIGTALRLSESRISQMHTELISRLRQRLYKEVAP